MRPETPARPLSTAARRTPELSPFAAVSNAKEAQRVSSEMDRLEPTPRGVQRLEGTRATRLSLTRTPEGRGRRDDHGTVGSRLPRFPVSPGQVHETLSRATLAEGYSLVLDLDKSRGQRIRDAITGRDYLDFFTFYASRPLAFDHPGLSEPKYLRRLRAASRMKPSNGDIYTRYYAEFVETFRRLAMGPGMTHLFFIDGGTLAVENALKAAFDWKARKNIAAGRGENPGQVLHFKNAFHGRSGYTLSLTNTADPRKTAFFPKFDWPRVSSPAATFPLEGRNLADVIAAEEAALQEIEKAYARLGRENIACILIEPIQCEGGDRHLRKEFLQKLREICDEREALLIFDEVQVGMGATGTMWYYEQVGVTPDIVAFGKKAQTSGIMAGPRLDEVDSVFAVKSRISSTFSGNLVDFVRCTRYLELMEEERSVENAKVQGAFLLSELQRLATGSELLSNARGAGLIVAVDASTGELRDRIIRHAFDEGLLVLPCGERGIRFRPALDVTRSECEDAIALFERAVARCSPTAVG